jgi:hypothetical protein
MTFSPDDEVVEAIPSESTDHTLRERIGLRSSRRGQKRADPQSADTASEVGAID